jgi:hypothetical protein
MKRDRSVKKITANLDVLRFPSPPEAPAGADCLNCSGSLTLSQPDPDSPERLIGVCDRCKHWFLINLIIDQGEGIISGLPDIQIIRNLSRENPGQGISVMGGDAGAESAPRLKTTDGPDTTP